jgi:hypothetical protein
MLRRQRAGFAFEFRPAYYEQGSILHQVDTRRTRLMPVQSAIYGVTQRTGRAHLAAGSRSGLIQGSIFTLKTFGECPVQNPAWAQMDLLS